MNTIIVAEMKAITKESYNNGIHIEYHYKINKKKN